MIKNSLFAEVLFILSLLLALGVAIIASFTKIPIPDYAEYILYVALGGATVACTYNFTGQKFYGRPLTPEHLKDGEYHIKRLGEGYRTFLIWRKSDNSEDAMRTINDWVNPYYFPPEVPSSTLIQVILETEKIQKTTTSGTLKTIQRVVKARWMEETGEKTATQVVLITLKV